MAARASALRKCRAVFSLHIQDSFAYRAQGIIWIISDTVPTITLPLMWLAAFGARTTLNGFTKTELVAYYLAMAVCTNLVNAHPWEIAHDIKEGRLSIYLTRPFSYYWFIFASNLSWRLVRTVLFVPFFALILIIFRSYLVWADYNIGADFWLSLTLAHLLSYQIAWTLGLMAFYLIEVGGLYEFYYMIGGFLAGQMAPLQMLPAAVRELSQALPFAYVLWFPVQVFLGKASREALVSGLWHQVFWIAALAIGAHFLWRAGLKRYTAVGI
jgi:ABC-2 type transport system permease protein